ncbi:hypothetical protein [Jannaschia aquimarina]|uniref:Uncharacterized protein n=1 Tax=Jannaschia aquimarina TaxID=935700 RepID=A0A0D1EGA5_9RHOB|nr:hypothetical protein [Jannaschia aquimarina]KIT15951.1 hypothetical protein jaqu_22190 [Jannaschia aquimarina]SNS98533.1 hypothetical protein SAMN05421775_104130 [Jannaschia aquimarina]
MTGAASAQDADAGVAHGYKVQGQTGASVVLARTHPGGARPGAFRLVAPDVTGCMDVFPDSGVWADLCVAANQREGNRFRIPFVASPQKGDLIQAVTVEPDAVGFPFELTMMLNSDDDVLSVSASEVGEAFSPTAFTDSKARFEAIRTMGADETEVTAVLQAGGFAVRLDLGSVQANGHRRASMSFYYNYEPGRDCLANLRQTGNRSGWARLCEKADEDGLQELTGILEPLGGGAAHTGVITTGDGFDFRIVISQARQNFARVGLRLLEESAFTTANAPENVILDGITPQPLPAPAPPSPADISDAVIGYRLGAFTVAEVSLSPVSGGQRWEAKFKLDAKVDEYGYESAASDCPRTLSLVDYAWGRQCEKATKDGLAFEMSGTLEPVSWRTDAFSGLVSSPDGGWTYHMLVVNPTQRAFEVALTDKFDAGFTESYQLIEFDTMARPLGSGEPVGLAALVGNWRVPQEDLADIGFDLEMSLEQVGGTMRGKAIAWFRAETDQISGFCPSTSAMLRICEKIQKGGPLEIDLNLDERARNASNGWRGVATPIDFDAGPYEVDFFEGSSIPDWGDQESDAHYLRFRTPGMPPGSEAVAWLKVERIERATVTLDELTARGTYDRPPVVPPVSTASPLTGTTCETLADMMAAISRTTRYPEAVTALSNSGFWAGLPQDDPDECARAARVLADRGLVNLDQWTDNGEGAESLPPPVGSGWPTPGTSLYSKVIGARNTRVELTRASDGRPVVRIPRFENCMSSGQPVCEAMKSNPGDLTVFNLASSDGNTIGMFNLGGGLYLARIADQENGDRMAYISVIEMESTFGLGALTAQ